MRGLLLASLVIPAGVALWVLLWQFGFIASIVAFGISYGAIWLYEKGAKAPVTKSVAPALLAIMAAAVILAFLGGIVSDAWYAYVNELDGKQGFFSADFWMMVADNLTRAELWSIYAVDIVISVVFAAFGAWGVVMGLLRDDTAVSKK